MLLDTNRKLRPSEAAAYTGLSSSTLAKYRVFGGGPPFYKLGRRVVYDVRDLDSWVAERRRVSTSDLGGAAIHARPKVPTRGCRSRPTAAISRAASRKSDASSRPARFLKTEKRRPS
jgi:hypothetical protein